MPYKKYALVIAIAALMISSCTMSYSKSGATTPTTSPFTKPLPTGDNTMKNVEQYATQTAMAKTAVAEGGPTATLGANGATPIPSNTPLGGSIIPTNTPFVGGASIIPTKTPLGAGGAVPTNTQVPVTGRPATYTLQAGEFPYCIARRYNVDPTELLALSSLSDGVVYPAGTVLHIPQSGSFPGDRSLRAHPTTYTVTSSDETFYSIACLFGNVEPSQIAQANGIALGTPLTIGQAIKIP